MSEAFPISASNRSCYWRNLKYTDNNGREVFSNSKREPGFSAAREERKIIFVPSKVISES